MNVFIFPNSSSSLIVMRIRSYGVTNNVGYSISNPVYSYILNIYDLVWRGYGISTIVGYLMPTPVYTHILNMHILTHFIDNIFKRAWALLNTVKWLPVLPVRFYQMRPLRARVDLGAMKVYVTFNKSTRPEPHHPMAYCQI